MTRNLSHLLGAFNRSCQGLTLTASQQRFAELFFSGKNLCLAGAAGTGKSFILKVIFTFLYQENISYGRTSTTGVSAFNIGGQTIHSFAGLGLADEDVVSIIAQAKKKKKAVARIKAIDILFIDEISMAKGDLLNKLDIVMKYFRKSQEPFGGVQFVAVGDGLQLPPIFKGDEVQELFFQCRAWQEAEVTTFILKETVRQREGEVLLKILNDIRVGDTSSLDLLHTRINGTFANQSVEPIRVFCKNIDVSKYNKDRLDLLPGKATVFYSQDMGEQYHIDAFNKNCPAQQSLELKVGAQVILLINVNVTNGLTNGSQGVVKSFTHSGVLVKFANEVVLVERNQWEMKEQEASLDGKIRYKIIATRSQIPLKLSWAMTVHKTQGMTLDNVILDINEAFATGMAYTALSRVRSLECLSLTSEIDPRAIRVDKRCIEFYEHNSV